MRYSDRWYFRCIRDSMSADGFTKGNTPANYITTKGVIDLQQQQENLCYYCQIFMDWLKRSKKDGLTIERLYPKYPHLESNCVLCCKSCNSKKYTRDKGLLKRYFSIWHRNTFDIIPRHTNRRCTYIQ